MGKLVLFLADGTLVNVPLDKERLTIGRRPDNDVCLPYPAVSGEHAAVVTILADSFLEDLGSTNGTLVNGKAVLKHFLRDHDVVDIGRQRLTYMSDNDAKVDPLPPDVLRHQMLGLDEKVAAVRPANTKVVVGGGRRAADSRDAPLLADLDRQVEEVENLEAEGRSASAQAGPGGPPPVTGGLSEAPAGTRAISDQSSRPAAKVTRPSGARSARRDALPVRSPAQAVAVDTDSVRSHQAEAPSSGGLRVRVISGPSSGRSVPINKDQLTVGRVGVQVAAVRKVADGYVLVPIEGDMPPQINGVPVAAEGASLRSGDTFEVAGVRLELTDTA